MLFVFVFLFDYFILVIGLDFVVVNGDSLRVGFDFMCIIFVVVFGYVVYYVKKVKVVKVKWVKSILLFKWKDRVC